MTHPDRNPDPVRPPSDLDARDLLPQPTPPPAPRKYVPLYLDGDRSGYSDNLMDGYAFVLEWDEQMGAYRRMLSAGNLPSAKKVAEALMEREG